MDQNALTKQFVRLSIRVMREEISRNAAGFTATHRGIGTFLQEKLNDIETLPSRHVRVDNIARNVQDRFKSRGVPPAVASSITGLVDTFLDTREPEQRLDRGNIATGYIAHQYGIPTHVTGRVYFRQQEIQNMHVGSASQVVVRRPNIQVVEEEIDHADIVSFDCVPEDRVAVTPFFIQVFGVVNRPLQQLVVRVAAKMLHTV